MIAFGKPFIEMLIEHRMNLAQYFILYSLVHDRTLLKEYQKVGNVMDWTDYQALLKRQHIAYNNAEEYTATDKGKDFIHALVDNFDVAKANNPFIDIDDMEDLMNDVQGKDFNEFQKVYPVKVTRPNGKEMFLKQGAKDSKITYLKLLKKGYKAGDILRALKYELKMRDSNGDMKWMKSMKNWLGEECFVPYLEDLKSNNKTDNTVDYGGKVL